MALSIRYHGSSRWLSVARSFDSRVALSWLAALFSLGAAGFHFAVAPEHFNEWALFGWFFVVVAWLQAAWSLAVIAAPRRPVLIAGIVGNLLILAIWLWTRLISVPIGPEAGSPEAFTATDIVTAVFEAGVVFAAAGVLELRARTGRFPVLGVVVAALALTTTVGVVLAQAQPADSGMDGTGMPDAGTHVGH
jgi:hypothetical protein